jgi:hypothetical protein
MTYTLSVSQQDYTTDTNNLATNIKTALKKFKAYYSSQPLPMDYDYEV